MSDKVVWLERGWQPVYFGFCPSEKAWRREMKRLGAKGEPYPDSDGRCTTFEHKGKTCILVTIRPGSEKKRSRVEIAGLLCHEAMHIWREIRTSIGELEPSSEFEAYSMQSIFQGLYQAFLETRMKKRAKAHG